MDCSLPGFSVHGIFQAKVLEWGAIAFSDLYYQVAYFVNKSFEPETKVKTFSKTQGSRKPSIC